MMSSKKVVMSFALALMTMTLESKGHSQSSMFDAPIEHKLEGLKNLPQATSDLTATTVPTKDGEKIFLFGGCLDQIQDGDCQSLSSKAYLYNPKDDSYSELNDSPSPRARHATTLLGNKVYVFGGMKTSANSTEEILSYDLASGDWTLETAKLEMATVDGVAFTMNNKAYFAGGYLPDWSLNAKTYIYDGTTLSSDGPVMSIPRGDARAVTIGNIAYVIGGFDSAFQVQDQIESFDGATWTEHKELSSQRGDKACAAKEDHIYCFGGQGHGDETIVHETIEIYHPEANEWIHGGQLANHRFRFDAATVGNSIYVFGGQEILQDNGGFMNSTFTVLPTVIAYRETHSIYSIPTITLHGSGTTNPMEFFYTVMNIFERQLRIPVKLTYRATGSGVGKKEFTGNEESAFLPYTQFGAGDIPVDPEQFDNITKHGQEMAHVPFALGAIGLYANIPEQGSQRLELTACELAKIYKGNIKNWKDLAFDDRNQFLKDINKPIYSLHRIKGSSSTAGFTKYMHTMCPSEWEAELDTSRIDQWPCDSNPSCPKPPNAGDGSDNIQKGLESFEYSIGYLSVGHGYPAAIKPVAIENGPSSFTLPTSATIATAAANYNWPVNIFDRKYLDVNLVGVDGAYPIVLVSYMYVRKNLIYLGSSAALLQKFVEYILTKDQGQALLPESDFVPLPDNMRDSVYSDIQTLVLPDHLPKYEVETSSSAVEYFGASPWVLSARRKNFDFEYRAAQEAYLSNLNHTISTQSDDLKVVSSQVSAQKATIDQLSGSGDMLLSAEQTRSIAIAALVLAVFNLVLVGLVILLLCKLTKGKSFPREEEVEMPRQRQDSDGSNTSGSAAVRSVTKV